MNGKRGRLLLSYKVIGGERKKALKSQVGGL